MSEPIEITRARRVLLAAIAGGCAVSPEIQALFEKYIAARDAASMAEQIASQVREGVIARCGDLTPGVAAKTIWGGDPHYALMEVASDVSNEMSDIECACMDALLDCPATSAGDLKIKFDVVLSVWSEIRRLNNEDEADCADYHEEIALNLMKETQTLLGAGITMR